MKSILLLIAALTVGFFPGYIGFGELNRWDIARPWPLEIKWSWSATNGPVLLWNRDELVAIYDSSQHVTNTLRFWQPSHLNFEFIGEGTARVEVHYVKPLLRQNLLGDYAGFDLQQSTNLVDWGPVTTTNRTGFYRLKQRPPY